MQGDFSLTAGLLSTFSVINALSQWGFEAVQAKYLSGFAEDADIQASFAVLEASAAFNPFKLKTQAVEHQGNTPLAVKNIGDFR